MGYKYKGDLGVGERWVLREVTRLSGDQDWVVFCFEKQQLDCWLFPMGDQKP